MFSSIEQIIEDFRQGKMVILVDDEDRENEGDLIISAHAVRTDDINFMASQARGLICLTLTEQRCQQLNLPLMVSNNSSGTNFTVSIDAKEASTGISAAERAHTIRRAVDPNAIAQDFVQPGHVFPLMARSGGTLIRAGHTEAGCDLSLLAGEAEPAAVIVEIMNEDGSMARRPDLEVFAKKYGIKIGTIADLIRYRMRHEKLLKRTHSEPLDNDFGAFQLHHYQDAINQQQHYALTFGDYETPPFTLVRVHVQSVLHDMFANQNSKHRWYSSEVMAKIVENGHGVLVVLTEDYNPVDDAKNFGKGAAILSDLGIKKMEVLGSEQGNQPYSGFGLEAVRFIPKGDKA